MNRQGYLDRVRAFRSTDVPVVIFGEKNDNTVYANKAALEKLRDYKGDKTHLDRKVLLERNIKFHKYDEELVPFSDIKTCGITVPHTLNQSLTCVVGYLDMALTVDQMPDDVKIFIIDAQRFARRLTLSISDLSNLFTNSSWGDIREENYGGSNDQVYITPKREEL